MRWEAQQPGAAVAGEAGDRLFETAAVVRTFDSPHFAGMTFYEVHAKSILNRVPAASRVPFRWTINPYRGCSHACRYCFARGTHAYLDLDSGHDFDTKVVVKVNAAELLRRELRRRSWRGEHVAMGTNVDCYQRAEGRYRLMPGIIQALADARNPFSILTKGSLILRDLELLTAAARTTDVTTAVSVGFTDPAVWREVEPGTPSPQTRLQVCARLNRAGVGCGVLMAPILPGLTDSPDQLSRAVEAIAAAGATHITPIVLHLRPGAREWFMTWLTSRRPDLVSYYDALYRRSAYAPAAYQASIVDQVRELARAAGVGRGGDGAAGRAPRWRPAPAAQGEHAAVEQLSLLAAQS